MTPPKKRDYSDDIDDAEYKNACNRRRTDKGIFKLIPILVAILTGCAAIFGFSKYMINTAFVSRTEFLDQQKVCAANNLRSAIDETRVEQKLDDVSADVKDIKIILNSRKK